MRGAALLLAASLSAIAGGAAAQEGAADEAIVVTAQRSGAPMWTIETPRGTIILVGELYAVPETTPWFPDRLEAATEGAQRVILGARPKVSAGDILRMIFAGGKITRLPKGTVAADYLDEAQRSRLAVLEQRYDQDYSEKSFLITAFDLLARRLGFNRDTGKDATDVVRKAARRADVPAEPVGTVRGEDMLDGLAEASPESHLPCLDAAMTATELGADLIERRGADWRAFDVPAVMANPLELALGRCWPWADPELGPVLRGQWVEAIAAATEAEGVTLAVVPLRVLAEPEGVLDQLARRGLDIAGPAWR
ncbi:MAG TPA: TraB/GumN family protein [Croceibacterium sp.]